MADAPTTKPLGIAPKKLPRVVEAEELARPLAEGEDPGDYNTRIERANQIYSRLILDATLPVSTRIEVINSMARTIAGLADEIICRLRDAIPFSRGASLDDLIDLLSRITKSEYVTPFQRIATAVTLYNQGYIDRCYDSFKIIAIDSQVSASFRVEAARYLFGSETPELIDLSRGVIESVVRDHTVPSSERYKIIASFISATGVTTLLNAQKIRVRYDENFVIHFQRIFFNDGENDPRDRILAGQFLLQTDGGGVTDEEKVAASTILLGIAENENHSENLRADAADVVLRVGTPAESILARKVIARLGFSAVSKNNKNLADRIQTIYTNSQNIHTEAISKAVDACIVKMVTDPTIRVRPFEEIHREVASRVRAAITDPEKVTLALKALHRVSIDTATFTEYRVTLAEIFVHVWLRIKTHPPEIATTLSNRLFEELVEMGDTCSTGHSGRFVNVLSGLDVTLNIGFDEQIIGNVAGRIIARIRALDSETQNRINVGMCDEASEEDAAFYTKFVLETLEEIKAELFVEFVDQKYISGGEFAEYFDRASKRWLREEKS